MSHTIRTKRVIAPGFQFKVTVRFLCIALTLTLAQTFILNHTMMEVVRDLPHDEGIMLALWPELLLENLLFTLAYSIPITIVGGLLITFRVAGPEYRIKQHLSSLIRGEDPGPCRLRKGDSLGEVAELVTQLRSRLHQESGPQQTTEQGDLAQLDPPCALPSEGRSQRMAS